MTSELIIQPAGIADIETIRKLAHQIWPVAYGQILSKEQLEYMLHLIYSQESLQKQMNKGHRFQLAIQAGLPVGFAAWSETEFPGTYKLQKLYVRTDIQGTGVGKALLDSVMSEVKAMKADKLRLNVNRYNNALGFYQKMGFKITGEEDIDIGNNYFMNDFVMEIILE